MADQRGTKSVPSNTDVNPEIMIDVVMEDLSEKDRDELERELQLVLEEVMAERRKKLTCFRKTRGGVVKKGDTMKVSTLANSSFTLEELIHLINVSVNSKYGANLEGITWALTDGVKGSVESIRLEFKQESKKLPKQIRVMVQQVFGESRGKRDIEVDDTSKMNMYTNNTMTHGSPGNAGRVGHPGVTLT
jgi:hypothetical protein